MNTFSLKHKKSEAIISLNNGASLAQLILNDKLIIKDYSKKETYKKTYASAILFPFVNRVFRGKYNYKKKEYQLEKNDDLNAIHGFVFNKEFQIVKEEITANYHQLILKYKNVKKEKGFPFFYEIELSYTLYKNKLILDVTVINNDTNTFPFTIGWHPYFFTENRENSILKFESSEEIIHDTNMIPIKSEIRNKQHVIEFKDQKFDHCYKLNNNTISFLTPKYTVDIKISNQDNYLQIFTPSLSNHIAIEPVTGVSDSLNNKIGLQEIESEKSFDIQWQIQLKDD